MYKVYKLLMTLIYIVFLLIYLYISYIIYYALYCTQRVVNEVTGAVQVTKPELLAYVQTDARDKNTIFSEVRGLSGGERSFTTLCLLLALGSVVSKHEYIVYSATSMCNVLFLCIFYTCICITLLSLPYVYVYDRRSVPSGSWTSTTCSWTRPADRTHCRYIYYSITAKCIYTHDLTYLVYLYIPYVLHY